MLHRDKILADACRRDFFFFVRAFWSVVIPAEPVYNWHIPYLCRELQQVAERVKRNEPKAYDLVINVPPGSTKSTICTIMYPAWVWTIDSKQRIISSSYSGTISMQHAFKSRDIIKSDLYQRLFPDVRIRKEKDGKGSYENTKGGERFTTSTKGSVTGSHAHQIIVDDPLNPKQASSEKELESANDFMTSTLSSRKVDKAVTPTILIMQRLHQNDPTGEMLKKFKKNPEEKPIKHICLPAEEGDNIQPPELREKYVDGLLDPVRIPKSVCKSMKVDLGSYQYAGQMDQKPSPSEGGIWERGWFKSIPDEDWPDFGQFDTYSTDWDLAYTEKESNSASAFVSSGKIGNDIYIDNIGYVFREFPDLINFIKSIVGPHYIEAKASGKSACQVLNNQGITAIEYDIPASDKVSRTRQATPKVESGIVYVRESILEELLDDSKQGILMFPNNTHDDLNDAFVQNVIRQSQQREFILV